jgi:ABC-type antimicrobial peptide transport system permease subunit
VLLLVCLNVGWLFVARTRRLLPAFVTMRALGASPTVVFTAHLVSAACVAIIAVPAAISIAWALLRYGMTVESGVFSRTATPGITAQVMIVSCLLTLLASVVSCLPGALIVGVPKRDRDRRFEVMAMTAQVGLVFAAGAQAVLVALVLWSLSRTNVGLSKTDYVVASIAVRGGATVDAATQLTRYKLLLDRLAHRGLRVAAANIFPLTDLDGTLVFEPRRSRNQIRTAVRTRIVTPSYFQITGLIPTSGRLPTQADVGAGRIVVTEAFAAAILQRQPQQDVLGARTGVRGEYTIVGIARPVRQFSITEETRPEAYILYDDYVATQSTASMQLQHLVLLAETGADTSATLRMIREEVAELLPEADIQSAAQVRDLIDRSLGVNRLVAAGSVVFAAVALLLAALGLYAMVTHGLERRRREIGIRMALGATSGRVAVETVRPIGVVYGAGVCLGSLLLLSARSAIQSVMVPPPGVGYPRIATIVGTAAALLLAVLIVACYRPVKSAASTDPAVSLRTE